MGGQQVQPVRQLDHRQSLLCLSWKTQVERNLGEPALYLQLQSAVHPVTAKIRLENSAEEQVDFPTKLPY